MAIQKLVLSVAGMPGAGKSLVVGVALEDSYEVVVMGDVVRKETERKGLDPTPENIGKTMLELRQTEGSSVIARRCVPKMKGLSAQKIIVDGIRSLSEVEEFKRHFSRFTLLAVHSSPETRFKRLCGRQRSDDPEERQIFQERDTRELGVGLGNAIAMAEYLVVNEQDLQTAKSQIKATLRKIEEKWSK